MTIFSTWPAFKTPDPAHSYSMMGYKNLLLLQLLAINQYLE